MLHFFENSLYIIIIFGSLAPCILCDNWEDAERKELLDLIPRLYSTYRQAFDNDEETITFRRVLGNNKEYDIHVHKLIDVNGLKRHNLIIKEQSDDNPVIYINNPVETKIPHSYLTLQEFKEILTGRVLRQRNAFNKTRATLNQTRNTEKINRTTHFKKHVFKTKPKRSNLTLKIIKAVTKEVKVTQKQVKPTKKIPTVITSQTKIESVPHETVPETTVIKTSTETPTFVHNISISTDAVTTNNHNLSEIRTATKSPDPLQILRINVEKNYEPITADSIIKESSTYIKVMTVNSTAQIAEQTFTEETEPAKEQPTTPEVSSGRSTIEELIIKESTTEELTTVKLTTKKSTKRSTTEELIIKESTTEELTTVKSTPKKSTNEKPTTEESTTEKSTTEESTTEESTTEESTTEEPTTARWTTTVKTTTKSKRITLARPLVYLGGWDNGI